MVKFDKKSVSLSSLWVSNHDKHSDFYTSSWQHGESPTPMLVVRVVLCACSLAILTWSTVENTNPYWLIYLTNWGIVFVAATTTSGLAVSIVYECKGPTESTRLPWFVSSYWVLFNIGVTLSVLITALYWILLYNPDEPVSTLRLFWLDVSTHGITGCIMLAELVISRTPVRIAHVYQPLGLGLWYAAFTGIYYAAGGTDRIGNPYIYDVINWENVTQTIFVLLGSVVGLLILYLAVWFIAYCRDKISTRFVRSTSHDLPNVPGQQNSHIV